MQKRALLSERGADMDVASTLSSIMQQASGTSQTKGTDKTGQAQNTKNTKNADYGKTVGNPQLSDKAAEYYKQLKSKYGDMEFVLVSKDEIQNAKQNAAKYASKDKMVVLVDEEKIERMATDESYRKKYEGIIASSKNQLGQMADKMGGVDGIKGFGMQVNDDGTASFFAVTQKNNETMVKKLSEKRAAKKAAEKKAAKKAEKKAAEEKLKEKRTEGKDGKEPKEKVNGKDGLEPKEKAEGKGRGRDRLPDDYANSEDYEVIEASSMEDLFKRLEDRQFALRSDSVMTEQESYVGGSIDFRL